MRLCKHGNSSLVHFINYFSRKRANLKRQNLVYLLSSKHIYRPIRARVVSQSFYNAECWIRFIVASKICHFGHCLAIKKWKLNRGSKLNVCQFKQNYCKKQNKLIVFNTNIFIKVDFIHKMSIFFYFNTSFPYRNTHVNRSFVISLSSWFTRSWCRSTE